MAIKLELRELISDVDTIKLLYLKIYLHNHVKRI